MFRDEEFATLQAQDATRWAEEKGHDRYLELSIKGSTEVDWSAPGARRAFLAGIMADAERLLVAKVPKLPDSRYFTKQDFPIDLEAGRCT